MRSVVPIAMSLLLMGCLRDGELFSARLPQKAPDSSIGKTYWVTDRSHLQVCPGPIYGYGSTSQMKCFSYGKGTFTITDKVDEPVRGVYSSYAVKLSDGREGFIETSGLHNFQSETEHAESVKAKADCDRRGSVTMGMTKAQVIASCFGKPQRINRTVTAGGSHEQMVYGSGTYIYLENGKVRSWQDSSR